MKILRTSLLFLLGFFALYGCSENGNNPVEGISSFDVGVSSSAPDIELSSSEEIYSSSSSEDGPFLSSSEDELSSSSGVDYTNWVLKKRIDWDCEDSLCINKRKSYETNYDYISYTDPEHYTVVSIDDRSGNTQINAEGEIIRKTWLYTETATTRNGLNYSGTVIERGFTPDSLTLSYQNEYNYTSVRHPIFTGSSTHYEANGTKTYYENGEIVKTENSTGSGFAMSFTDLGIIDGLHCYRYQVTSISCLDDNNLLVKSEAYNTNGDLSFISTTTHNEILSTGEFAIWTGTTRQSILNNAWTEYESIREITEQIDEKIVIVTKSKRLITEPVNRSIYSIMEDHYGLP